jgi:outer membrane protein OmpA-like peptidoglycan-associated protein
MSLVTELFSMLDSGKIGEIAGALGESDHSVAQGMQSAIGTVLGGMAGKSGNPEMLQKLLDMAPAGLGGTLSSNLSSAMTDPNSSMMSAGKRILSTLFGGSVGSLTSALGSGTGLGTGATSSLLGMAAPMVMSFLGRRTLDQGMSMAGLGGLLQREAPAILSALPAGVSNLLAPGVRAAAGTVPVVAQAAAPARSWGSWILPLVLLALIPALWLLTHPRRTVVVVPPAPSGAANRVVPEAPVPSLPANLTLHFHRGSLAMQPDARGQLKDFVDALAANPNARISVNAYTDNTGNAAANLRLSEQEANAVKEALIRMGVGGDRITATGYGDQNPVADNATAAGREANDRVSVEVSDH